MPGLTSMSNVAPGQGTSHYTESKRPKLGNVAPRHGKVEADYYWPL